MEPRDLTLYRAAELLRRGSLTSEALILSCLDRIESRDNRIHAWAELHDEAALAAAQSCDSDAKIHRWRGPLHGLPLGIKDIIHVRSMRTQAGTAAYESHVAVQDAPCVEALRDAGAILLGKTVTTPFAHRDPSVSRNPWNPERSPGGSSAGSAAAVADRMCLAALGTQTGGSTLRPAAYNGIVGFKGGFGKVATDGLVPLSFQLDHVGFLTRDVQDAALLWNLLRRDRPLDWQSRREKLPSAIVPRAPRRVWWMREYFEQGADPEILAVCERVCDLLAKTGVTIVERPLPGEFKDVDESHATIMKVDAASWHQANFLTHRDAYPEGIGQLVQEGLGLRGIDYVHALHHRSAFIASMRPALTEVDFGLMPAAPGPAPVPSTTGSARFNLPWSFSGFPAIALPAGLSGEGMPLGVQLAAGPDQEDALLGMAAWVERQLAFDHRPA